MEIREVAERARQRLGVKSDEALAREIGMKRSNLQRAIYGQGFPSDAAMARLSRAAGLPVEEGLLLLNVWRSEGDVRTAYAQILKKISTRTTTSSAAERPSNKAA
jgi:transcriptional regulator with XRE-family HTH domain